MSEVDAPTKEPAKTMSQKASEYFGADYVGEVTEAAPLAASVEEISEEAPIEAEVPLEESEEITEEADVSVETDSEEPEEIPISSVRELIETNEYDPEWFNSLKVPVKVDGSESEATLSDLVKSYQIQGAAEHRLEEAKTKAKAMTQELADKSESLNAQFATVAELITNAEKVLTKDFEGIDWKGLRQKDPAEFAALQRDFERRERDIQSIKESASAQYQQHNARQSEEAAASQQEYLRQEADKLVQALPEWKDVEKAKAEKAQLAEYLINQGFTKDDVMAASDHRLIVLARKAMMFDSTAAKSNAALKKVAKVAKVIKPGTTKSAEQINNQKLERLRLKSIETGSLDDAFAYQQARRSRK